MHSSQRPTRTAASWLRHVWAACLAFVVLGIAAPATFAQAGGNLFDHQSTGFPLTGAHTNVRCETCHVQGIFKGTPRLCVGCHVQNNQRNATTIPSNHVQTVLACDVCHTTGTFGGARFDHVLVMGQSCASCHNGTQAQGKPANHPLTNAPCSDCHTTISFATAARPANHIPTLASSRCESCHVNMTSGGSLANAQMNHTGYTTCAQCHAPSVANSFFGVQIKSSLTSPQHIPASENCETCHTNAPTMLIPTTGAASVGASTFSGGRMSHAGITSNCVRCHSSSVVAGTFIGVTPKTKASLAPAHLPTSETCENCHGNAIPTQLIPATGAASIGAPGFANAQMNHTGIASNCVACHGPTVTGSSFFGVSRIVTMPATSPVGPTSHIPSSTTCESCHLGSTPSTPVPANATRTAPGTLFATPLPTGAQIHAGVTSGCSSCHESSFLWMGMSAYPISPAVLTSGASYTGFHTRPRAGAGTFNVADPAHPTSGDCSQCHSNTNAFSALDKPANHIPYAAAAQCNSCHTNPDFSVMPALSAIHANAQSTTGNCAQCHSATAAAGFAIPSIGFRIVAPPGNHVPTSAPCESCHVGASSSVTATPVPNGATFANSRMNHAGITNNCVACHTASGSASTFAGITNIVRMPPTSPVGPTSHIPSSTTCETCHVGSVPMGQIAANAVLSPPGTGFASPTPTSAQIHSGITGGCSGCHESNYVWMGMSAYPISPSVLTAGAQYTGFHSRPRTAAGTFNVADPAHPTSGDCSQCHGNTTAFSALDKPANHIPYATTAQCTSCHTNPDFSVMPTLVNIHTYAESTTTNCAQCHGAAAASFAIPAANFSIVGLPSNHIPTSAACESCHVGTGSSVTATPVPNGAKFSGSRMSHAGITNNCESCHTASGSSTTFAGITNIVRMPATSPMGLTSHIPSGTACASCHLGTLANVSGLVPANATRSAPGTLFATPAPTTAQIHSGITGGCSGCHESNYVWMGMSAYPISPSVLTAGAQYTGFHSRPRTAAGTFNVADAAHPTTGDCSQCHSGFSAFTAQDKPANHIPYATAAQCTSCHTNPDFSVMPTLANIHANAPSTTTNCAQCHGAAAASFAIPAANFSIVGLPSNHIPTSAACESCHVGTGSSVTATPVPNGAKFSGSRMSHAGITNNCESCHTASGSSTTFAGITNIVRMPATSPMGLTSHIPSGTACASCHLGTLANVSGLVPANATRSAPGTLFATPAPTTAQIHSGITGGCSGCHESNYVWMGMSAYPISPSVLTAGAQYTGFHSRPRTAAGTFNVADAAHPTTGDCSQCHSGFSAFTAQDKPANHIPYATAAQCTSCHTNPDFSVMPTLANIHANAPSTTTNCAQCHGAAAASFAIPAANFSIVGLPSNHIPTSAACESCHVGTGSSVTATPVPNGAKFSGSRMSHAGITNNCESCHTASGSSTTFAGITNIVRMPATSPMGLTSHIPSGTACASCHLGTLANVSGLVPANATRSAPGTLFATPAPTTAQIHSGITGGCSGCHESNYVWMGMSAYPISPSVLTAGAQYTGFHSRPRTAAGTFNVADAAHPTTGDCSQCHSGFSAFTAQDKPANHIPYATAAQCTSCHTNPDFSVMPTLANIHANAPSTTTNCAQCHGAAAASFAIPAANFSIVGLPSNHIPTSAACESCHVGTGSSVTATPVPNGAKFSGSRMSHAGITNNCESCHTASGSSTTFAGITNIVRMPATSPMGLTSHIPSGTACASCHLGTLANVSGLVPANATRSAPGTLFATPAPTTAQIHSGITGGCSGCHESNYVWMGMSAYPISPSVLTAGAQYTGFHSRPRTAAGTFNVADAAHPTTGDCSQCHSGFSAFTAQDKPANHIPYATAAQCTSCHTNPDFSVMPTLANIHANAPSTTTNCAQCHGAAAASFAIPAANFSIVGLPSNHIPTSAACESCHVGTGSSVTATPVPNGAKFSGSRMSHAGITNNCESCHTASGSSTTFAGITNIVRMPATSPMGLTSHIPSGTACASCHLGTLANVSGLVPANATRSAPGTLFATPAPTTAQIHSGITGGCSGCHESNYVWMGMSAYPISPSVLTAGAQYTGFHSRPRTAAGTFNVADAAHPTTGDCSQCHSGFSAFTAQDKPANHIPYATAAQCTSCHTNPDFSVMPTLANIHANAPSTTTNCAQCHGAAAASFAIPAANFSIVGLPSNHIPTSAACESCHVGTGSSVTATPVPNGAKFSGSRMSHAGITNNCVACHTVAGSGTTFAGITNIVRMPATSPMGPTSHIPSSTTCESCHQGTLANVGGLIPANATRAAPGTLFATPAPTSAQIHSGITGGCNACHDTGFRWMGMSSYPIAPTTLVAGAQYTGFHTRPVAAASTFSVADAAHPTTGDCSLCHSGTSYFSAQAKPPGHIPTQGTCATCHVVPGDFSIAGLTASMVTMHTGITSGCIACHTAGAGAGPFAGCATQASCSSPPPLTYQPKAMPLAAGGSPTAPSPQTHVPATGIACEKCHVTTTFATFAGMQMKGNTTAHQAVGAYTCITCHEGTPKYTWFGVNIVTRPVGHEGRKAGQDCVGSGCHRVSYNQFNNSAILKPVLRSAITAPRMLPGGVQLPNITQPAGITFDHQGVLPGQCKSCHNGVAARGLSAKHLPVRTSCDTCHRTTTWRPAQFSHQGIAPGECTSCHNGALAPGKPGAHFMSARSCDTCHRMVSWLPATYSHVSPAYRPAPDKPFCVSCHVTNGEIIPRVMHSNPRVRPIPATPGP